MSVAGVNTIKPTLSSSHDYMDYFFEQAELELNKKKSFQVTWTEEEYKSLERYRGGEKQVVVTKGPRRGAKRNL